MSAHGVIDAAMSAQPSAGTPATAQTTIGTTPEVMSRTLDRRQRPHVVRSDAEVAGRRSRCDEEAETDRGDGDAGEDGEDDGHWCHEGSLE